MNYIKTFLLAVCLVFQMNAYSQKAWSLQACIDYGLTHNLQLKAMNYKTESRKENNHQAYRNLLPSINANTNYRIRYGRSIDNQNRVTFNENFSNFYSVNASIDLFQGFKKWNTIAATKFMYKGIKEETKLLKYLLAFRIMNAYYDVLFFEGLIKISKEQVLVSKNNYEFIQKQIQLGLKAGVDVYESEAILINDQLQLVKNKNQLAGAKLKLQQEMNVEIVERFNILKLGEPFEFLNTANTLKTNQIYQKALSFSPSIHAQELYVKASEKEVKIAKGDLYPSLSFSSGYSTNYFETDRDNEGSTNPFKQQFKNNASEFISLNLRIPIFNKWSFRSRVKQQKIALATSTNQLNIKKQELYKVIQELVQSYSTTKASLKLTQKNEEMRALAFQIAQKKYSKGLLSSLELNQSKNLYAKAQNEKLQTLLKLEINKKTLAFYKGIPIFNTIY